MRISDDDALAAHKKYYDELKTRFNKDFEQLRDLSGQVKELTSQIESDDSELKRVTASMRSSDQMPESTKTQALSLALKLKALVEEVHRESEQTKALTHNAESVLASADKETCTIQGVFIVSNEEARREIINLIRIVNVADESVNKFMTQNEEVISLANR